MEISETMITKLFDTLKSSIDSNEKTLSKSVDYTIDTMNYIKPKIETIDDNIVKSKTLLEKLSKKVGTMILVVVIAFALMTSAYYIARSVHDISQHKIEQKIELEKN